MLKSKTFSDILKVCSVLPALLVMPAMGVNVNASEEKDLTADYPDGNANISVLQVKENATAKLYTKTITINSSSLGVQATTGSKTYLGNENTTKIDITGTANMGFRIFKGGYAKLQADEIFITSTSAAQKNSEGIAVGTNDAANKAEMEIKGNNLTVKANQGMGISIQGENYKHPGSATLDVDVTGKVKVTTESDFDGAYILNANLGGSIDIKADEIELIGKNTGLAVMSAGALTLTGKTTITNTENSETVNAIATRGNAKVKISNIQEMLGLVNFAYWNDEEGQSRDYINATVDLTIGEGGKWTGNTLFSWHGMDFEEVQEQMKAGGKLEVKDGMNLTMKKGSYWDATVVDKDEGETNPQDGHYYLALNSLDIDGGKIDIRDTENGITTKTATITDAVINKGILNITESLELTSSLTGTGGLAIASGATADIGDSLIDLKSITLDGTMNAVLDSHNPLFGSADFSGEGSLSLTAKKAGEYNLTSGDNTFAGEHTVNSSLFDATWIDDNTVSVTLKSTEEIAANTGLTTAAAQTATNLAKSSSEKLNDFGVLVQNSLAAGDIAAVEHASKAINPEDASVAQSLAGHVQGTVATLAANRMALATPNGGRAGGDATMTAGGIWAQGLFNRAKLNGGFNGYTRGVAAGIDMTDNHAFTIGVGYAFNHSDVAMHTRNTEIDSNTVFAYGQYKPANWYINATANYTSSSYDESGDALGVAIDADYNIASFGAQAVVGYDMADGLTPEIGVRYMHLDGDTYTTSLGIKNKIDSADYLTTMIGAKYASEFDVSRNLTLRPEIHGAVKYDIMSDDARAAVTMPGIDTYTLRADRLSRTAAEAGIAMTMTYMDVDISLSYDIEVRKDYTSQTGMVRARYNF